MEPVVLSGGMVGQYGAIWRDLTDGEDLDEAAREGLEFYRSKLASVQEKSMDTEMSNRSSV